MKHNCLPEDIQKVVKEPFVFISYCHSNQDVFDRVQRLALFLRNRNIPIVYDEGGLPPGTELTQFEDLILDNNCKCVLVVSDKCYLRRIEDNQGGAWREYFNISNDYPNNRNKYVPLKVDAQIPIFIGKVYIDFQNDSQKVLNDIENALSFIKKGSKKSRAKVGELLNDASLLCDRKNYNAAENKIDEAIKIYSLRTRTVNSVWAKLYNLKLYVCIHNNDINNAIEYADNLLKVISNRLDYEKRTIYYGNCALAYRMRDIKAFEYEECAKHAYQMALKGGNDELEYYACMYATALYETEQWNKAYYIIKEADREFVKKYPDKNNYTRENNIMYIKIKGNIASISIERGKNEIKNRSKRYAFFLEAKKSIVEILNMDFMEVDDEIYKEMYHIAEKVFSALKEFYE